MKLTGKAKEEFEKWLSNYFCLDEKEITVNTSHGVDVDIYPSEHFNTLTDSMQYGVYVDFFDSVGLFIDINGLDELFLFWVNDDDFNCTWDMSLQEAREQAIKKANEIFNNKN